MSKPTDKTMIVVEAFIKRWCPSTSAIPLMNEDLLTVIEVAAREALQFIDSQQRARNG